MDHFLLEKLFQFTEGAYRGCHIDQQDGVEDAYCELHEHVAAEKIFPPIVESQQEDVDEEETRAGEEEVPQHGCDCRACSLEEERRRSEYEPEKYQTQENREVVDDRGFIGNDEFVDFLGKIFVVFVSQPVPRPLQKRLAFRIFLTTRPTFRVGLHDPIVRREDTAVQEDEVFGGNEFFEIRRPGRRRKRR